MKLLTSLSLIIKAFINIYAQNYNTDTLKMVSEILNEERIVIIYTPQYILENDSVSMLYMLDGEFSDYRYKIITEVKYETPVIGIAIINTDSKRDMLPINQAAAFLIFIENELIPVLENHYRVSNRILFGHSFAGAFTIYSMINKPGLFDKYIASSPTPIMDMVDQIKYSQLDSSMTKQIKFYFSYGSEDMKQVIKWCNQLNTNLTKTFTPHIIWKCEVFEKENHNTSDIISLKKGLNY